MEMETLEDVRLPQVWRHAWARPGIIAAIALAVVALVGCSPALSGIAGSGEAPGGGSRLHGGAAVPDRALEAPAEAVPALALLADTAESSIAEGDGQSADPGAALPSGAVDGALIVRTASLELEVPDVGSVLREARAAIAGLGGYVSGSDEWDQAEERWASLAYRVPVGRFEEAIHALRRLASRVVRESTQSTEVTAAIVDMDARLTNLRASEAALVAIMERATRIDDVLAVQLRLEDVRGQVERLEAQRTDLADQAAMSTLSVIWFTPVAAVTVAQAGWDPGAEVDAALAQTLAVLQGLAGLAIWLAVVLLPLLLVPALLLVLALVVLRRRLRRRGGPGSGDAHALAAGVAE
jgi:hypothetical protein